MSFKATNPDRPNSLNDYFGQQKIISNLKIYIKASQTRQSPLDHMLFYGGSGLRKNFLDLFDSSRIE